jgi:hypothetical protein
MFKFSSRTCSIIIGSSWYDGFVLEWRWLFSLTMKVDKTTVKVFFFFLIIRWCFFVIFLKYLHIKTSINFRYKGSKT